MTTSSQTRNPPSFQPQLCLSPRHVPPREDTDMLYLHHFFSQPPKSCLICALLSTGWKQRGMGTGILLLNSVGQAHIPVNGFWPSEELVRKVRSYQWGQLPNTHAKPEVKVITVLSTSVFLRRYSCTSYYLNLAILVAWCFLSFVNIVKMHFYLTN